MKFTEYVRTPIDSSGHERIAFLDGFRGIAILLVMLYHYYSRYANGSRQIYPFGNVWADFPLFSGGHYGVQLFFAVSGFVITMTLTRCDTVLEFAVRRWARLWPAMLLCSILTFLFLSIFPIYWNKQLADFLPSLTFIDGHFYEILMPGRTFEWIDGAYWSLFVEVRFYAIVALLYFFDKDRFFKHVTIFSVFSILGYWAIKLLKLDSYSAIYQAVFIPGYLPWFLIGISAYCWHVKCKYWSIVVLAVVVSKLIASAVFSGGWTDLAVGSAIVLAFMGAFISHWVRAILSAGWLVAIGISSYSLYLLHQNIGVTAFTLLAKAWSVPNTGALVIPVCVSLLMIGCARSVYRYWEAPMNSWIVKAYIARLKSRAEKAVIV